MGVFFTEIRLTFQAAMRYAIHCPFHPANRRNEETALSFSSSFQPNMKTFTRILLISLALSFCPSGANAAVLERVTSRTLADGKDVVSILFQGRSEPQIFSLDGGGSPRLVFDFPGAQYLGSAKIAVDGAVVKAARIATHQNPLKTRVVFDLIPGHDVDYNQEFLEDSQTLRIVLSDKSGTPVARPPAPKQAVAPASKEVASKEVAPKEMAPRQKTEPPAESPATLQLPVKPPPTPAKFANTTPSPFDSPFLTEETPAEPTGSTTPDETASPVTSRMFGYSLDTQATGGDVLRLQLDGYASPKVTAREGKKPQIICFFPQMRLALEKRLNQTMSGKFVRKVAVSAQKKPVGVQVVLDLEDGYDYDIQQIFIKDETAFLLVVNVFNP